MRLFKSNPCKIVYRSEYLTAVHSRSSYRTFDPMRFKKIYDKLITDRLIKRKDIIRPAAVSEEDMLLVHTKEYLNSLKNPMIVGEILNLDYVDPWDNYVLEYFRYMVGGTIVAAQYALENNTTVFNLGGGYHHAHPIKGEGFCLLNDAAIAIEKHKLEFGIKKVLVIDLDYHQGNGILLFYKNNPDVFTFSMHADNWEEIDKTNNIDLELPAHTKDEEYLKILMDRLPPVFSNFNADLAIYLAGSDPFIDDEIGDFDISAAAMLKRDMFVHNEVRKRKIPLVVLAAGGYGQGSWQIYYNFIKWVIRNG